MKSRNTTGFSASWLKYFACFFMVIDHADAMFSLLGGVAQPYELSFYLLRALGRVVFPIFAWFVAEGCRKTSNLPDYVRRLFLFALAAQIPFSLAFQNPGGSVILTFFLAASAIAFYESARQYIPAPLAGLLVIPVAILSLLCQSDYNWFGVVLVFVLYLCRTKKSRLIALACSLVVYYLLFQVLIVYWPAVMDIFHGADPLLVWEYIVAGLPQWFPFYLPYNLLLTTFSLVSLLFLARYNGQRGTGNKYFFYVFYPLHLIILTIIARCIA